MAKIIVQNGDWDAARAKLKTNLDSQQADFNAQMKAVFAPKTVEQPAAAAPASPRARSSSGGLPRAQSGGSLPRLRISR